MCGSYFHSNGSPAQPCTDHNDQLVFDVRGHDQCADRVGRDPGGDYKGNTGSEFSDISLSDCEEGHRPVRKKCSEQRLVVVHNYHDHLKDPLVRLLQEKQKGQPEHQNMGTVADSVSPSLTDSSMSGPRYENLIFPEKLHYMLRQLEKEGLQHVVRWNPHGRSFVVGDKEEFLENIVPRYGIETIVPILWVSLLKNAP
jgi:HSF-type DNA-binding